MSKRIVDGGVAALLASASLILAGAAQAAPTWLSATQLSATGFSAEAPRVSVDARGDAVAAWRRNGIVEVSGRPAGAAGWQAAQTISLSGATAAAPLVGIDAAGDALVAWRSLAGGEESIQESARTGLSGSWSTPVVIKELGMEELAPPDPDLAVAPNGAATIVWQRQHDVDAASRPAKGGFGSPETVSEAAVQDEGPRVALDAGGDATTVFELEAGERVIASSTRPAGGKWSSPTTISEPLNVNVPSVAVNARGDAVAVWEAFFEEMGAGTDEEHIQVATRPAGASAWSAPVTLTKSETGLGEPGNQEVAIDGEGDAVAIWGRMHGANAETIETSQDHALGSSWSAPVTVSGPGKMEEAPQIAVNDAGHATIVWERQEASGTEIVEASSGSASGVAWQPSRAVSASTPGSEAKEPAVAMDAEGNAAAVWAGLDGGFYIAEAAGFDAAGPAIGALSIPSTGSVGQALSFSLSATDVWSALRATTWSFGDGQSASGTSVTHAYANAGAYTVTVTSTDVLGNTTSASASVAVGGGGIGKTAPEVLPLTAPQLTGARLTHTRFRVAKQPTAVTASAHGKPPLGTGFHFTLNEAASVRIVFTRSAPGVRSDGRCVAPTRSRQQRHARRCTRTLSVGALIRAHENAGADSVAFSGHIGTHALAPGAYRATLTATANGLSSAPSKLALTIAR
ncbi:MAG TPA: PKD domain-containing protein [Solirubrobacteraceae bacterium]|jgi:hypothetical protein